MKTVIKCQHNGKDGYMSHVISFGDEQAIGLCPQCYASIQGMVLSDIMKDAMKDVVKKAVSETTYNPNTIGSVLSQMLQKAFK